MTRKGQISPDPYMAHVKVLPHAMVGTLEIVAFGDSIDEQRTPAWAASRFYVDGDPEKETTGFGFEGEVLVQSGISIDEIDNKVKVKVYLQPKEGEYGTVSTGEEDIKEQLYKVVKFERV